MKSRVFSAILFLTGRATAGPVEDVVKLLTTLQENIEADGKSEQLIYDKYSCWCESTTGRKAAAIETARDDLRTYGQDILKFKGKAATLAAEIAKLTQEIKENEEAQAEATAIRQKENTAYQAEAAEIKQALAALEQAVTVLKDATGAAFLQHSGSANQEATLRLRNVLASVPKSSKLTVSKIALLRRAASGGKNAYAPQSATIQGILGDMYKEFSTDLELSTKEEGTKNRNFEDFIAVKSAELKQMKIVVAKKTTEKTETEVMLAETEQAYDDTEGQMKADVEFFDATKSACSDKSAQWSERSKLRKEELAGIAEALTILSSDEARELFDKSIKPGAQAGQAFLQVNSVVDAGAAPAKRHAYEALKSNAQKTHSLRLARLAAAVSSAKVGHFDKVLKAIDDMIATLRQENLDDIDKRDECIEEYKNIDSTLKDHAWKIEVNEAKIAKYESQIEAAEKEKAETIKTMEELNQTMIEMKTQRTTENQEFLQAKSDDEQAIVLLKQAVDALMKYHDNNNVTIGPLELVQQGPEFEKSADQAPEADFSGKGNRKGESKGILSILANIIEDLGGEIRVGQRDEAAAQLSYEDALAAAQKLYAELEEKVVNLEGVIAEKTQKKLDETTLMEQNEATVKTTNEYKAEIKPDCDWMLGAFETRNSKRTAEMDGLVQAKEFLAGYQMPEE